MPNIEYQISKIHSKNVKIFMFLICMFGVLFLMFDFATAQPLSSPELINNARQYDGKTVVYEGEVIGDVMSRGDYAWVNLNDGNNAIGIWLPKELTKEIVYSGSYKSIGDRIEVIGIFQEACVQHGGDLDIHVQSLRKVTSGRWVREKLNLEKRRVSFIFLGILGVIWILTLLKRK